MRRPFLPQRIIASLAFPFQNVHSNQAVDWLQPPHLRQPSKRRYNKRAERENKIWVKLDHQPWRWAAEFFWNSPIHTADHSHTHAHTLKHTIALSRPLVSRASEEARQAGGGGVEILAVACGLLSSCGRHHASFSFGVGSPAGGPALHYHGDWLRGTTAPDPTQSVRIEERTLGKGVKKFKTHGMQQNWKGKNG